MLTICKTHCDCHPETCSCGDYTLLKNGKPLLNASREALLQVIEAAPMDVMAEWERKLRRHTRRGHRCDSVDDAEAVADSIASFMRSNT